MTADLCAIHSARAPGRAPTELRLLKNTHQLVVWGLAGLVASGILLVAADAETYLHSRIFWSKMGFMALLFINGAVFLTGERQLRHGDPGAWPRIHTAAVTSLLLWTLTTLAGVALLNI